MESAHFRPGLQIGKSVPWAFANSLAGRPVVFACLDDLPPEASIDRAFYQRIGLKSLVSVPLLVGGELQGALSFGCVRRERGWSDELVGRLQLLAQIFSNALAHKRAQEELDQALGFERLAADTLAALLLAAPEDQDVAMERGLRDIAQNLGGDRATLWERLPSGSGFRKAYRWLGEGIADPPDRVSVIELPWIGVQLNSGTVLRLSRLSDLPSEAEPDKLALRELGIRSLLMAPLSASGEIVGALSVASLSVERTWPEALVPRLRLLAEGFASLYIRRAASRAKQAAETEAMQWRERLAHLVRVHTVGEMSAAIVHEITQPLGAIENYALAARRRAQESEPDLAKIVELLDKTVGQAARAGGVVTRLRGLVKRHTLDLAEVDLERSVRTCIEMVKADGERRGIGIELRVAEHLPRIIADEIHVQQVVLNLLRNSIEAIALTPGPRQGEIIVNISRDRPGAVTVGVADNGPGIEPDDPERVFVPFFSTKSSGLGVGLAICRKLIEAHGGKLWAARNPDGGALFQFTLPVRAVGS